MENQEKAKLLTLTPPTLADPGVDPVEWIERYARLHQVDYHYKTNAVREYGEPLEASVFISAMRLTANRLELGNVKKMLPDAMLIWRRNQARQFLASLRQELKFKPSDRDLVADWVEAATGERNPLDIAVVRHFVWQVRRKLSGLPVEHHMMLILFGVSGGGKSVAVHKLIGPLQDVSTLRDLSIFSDQFAKRAFARSYIMFFDELSKSDQTDVNALKNVVTAPTIEWRGIGSESIHSAPQNSTFIGCSNSPVRERIQDPTSSRRFWQLNCAERLSWEKINAIDYLALWQSVDETAPCPILECLDAIRVVQEREIQHKDLIENWLENSCEPAPFDSNSPGTDGLYSAFSEWCRGQTIYGHEGLQTFARGLQLRINQLRWEAGSKRSHRGTVWSLRLKNQMPEPNPILGFAEASEAVSVDAEPTEPQGDKE